MDYPKGVQGEVYSPDLEDAKVKNHQIAKQGKHVVRQGSLVELRYRYPTATGGHTEPSEVLVSVTAVHPLALQFITIQKTSPGKMAGAAQFTVFMLAAHIGKQDVTIDVDGNLYNYRFTVT